MLSRSFELLPVTAAVFGDNPKAFGQGLLHNKAAAARI
jgi:hypothetical protein